MGFKYLWILAPELFKAKQLFVADDRRGLEMGALARRGSWSGVPWSHPQFVLEFSLISVVSVYWGNERKKEKIQRKRWDLRENEGKKQKKKSTETEREETFTTEDQDFPPLLRWKGGQNFWNKFCLGWNKFPYTIVPFWNNVVLMTSCGYVVRKEPHNFFFFS